MNIFYLDHNPYQCAIWHNDKHVIKMILESAQLLSTCHRVLDGYPSKETYINKSGKQRTRTRYRLENSVMDQVLYKATHLKHPDELWLQQSVGNYKWLFVMMCELMKEYTYRYGKHHKTEGLINELAFMPHNIPLLPFTVPPQCMPEECKIPGDTIEAYHNYYRMKKSHFAHWKNRPTPPWINA